MFSASLIGGVFASAAVLSLFRTFYISLNFPVLLISLILLIFLIEVSFFLKYRSQIIRSSETGNIFSIKSLIPLLSIYIPVAVSLIMVARPVLGLNFNSPVPRQGIFIYAAIILIPLAAASVTLKNLYRSGIENNAFFIGILLFFLADMFFLKTINPLGISFLSAGAGFLLLSFLHPAKSRKYFYALIASLMIYITFSNESVNFHSYIRSFNPHNKTVNKYMESQITPYGELAVHKIKNASYHISLNHTPLTNNSHIDTEKNIHLTMLQYPWAERILLIGGTNKAVEEILRYPDVGSVYWGNVTPDIFSLPQDLFPTEVSDPQRLRMIKSSDARDFMHKFNVSDFFDVVIIDIPEPLNIFFNRYYSLEFFKNLSDVSVPHSILNLQIQAGEDKLSKNEKNLSAVIFNTLKKNFPNTMQMKIKRTVVLSSPERGFTTSPLPLIEYLNSIDGVPETITPAFLRYTFASSEKILRQIENAPYLKLNSDLNPISLKYSLNEILYSLGIWHDFILKSVNNIKSFVIYVFFILPAIAGIFVFKKKSPEVKTAISFSIICAIWTIFLLTAATILHASSGKLYSGVSYLAFAGLGGVFICLKLLYSDKKYISYSFISKYCVLASLFFLLATSLLEFYLYPSIIIIALTVFTGSFILTGATAAAAANVFNKKPLLLYATASSAAALALSVLLLPAINLTEIFLLNVIFIISLIFLLNT